MAGENGDKNELRLSHDFIVDLLKESIEFRLLKSANYRIVDVVGVGYSERLDCIATFEEREVPDVTES